MIGPLCPLYVLQHLPVTGYLNKDKFPNWSPVIKTYSLILPVSVFNSFVLCNHTAVISSPGLFGYIYCNPGP